MTKSGDKEAEAKARFNWFTEHDEIFLHVCNSIENNKTQIEYNHACDAYSDVSDPRQNDNSCFL
jgi:hypothetical protein